MAGLQRTLAHEPFRRIAARKPELSEFGRNGRGGLTLNRTWDAGRRQTAPVKTTHPPEAGELT
jgi:hypothetical protein